MVTSTFRVEKNALEEFKVKFSFENELIAIMYESNLIHFADGELKFRNRTNTQVIVTSAHIDPCELTKNYRQLLNRATETNKPDRVALFENRFMRKDSIRVIGMQTQRMNPSQVIFNLHRSWFLYDYVEWVFWSS